MTSITRSVLITGATGGVGSALVSRLADRGWRVFAGTRSLAAASSLAAGQPKVVPVELDVLDAASIARARTQIAEDLQRAGHEGLGGLVNNAGKSVDGPLELLPLADLQDAFAVNVVGQIAVIQAFLPLLRQAHGRIVNMGGAAGRVAMPMYGALSASKAALDSVTDVLRMELQHQGVDVIYVEPGALDTTFFARSAAIRAEHGYAGDPDAQARYAEAVRRVAAAFSSAKPAGLDPVLNAIEQALSTRRPAARYVVGRDAKAITRLVRRLPTDARDRVIMRNLHLSADAFQAT
jgi:NAD(P)-dependent dehydrogenase (short-subunit alcohol dehydrogenase family)